MFKGDSALLPNTNQSKVIELEGIALISFIMLDHAHGVLQKPFSSGHLQVEEPRSSL